MKALLSAATVCVLVAGCAARREPGVLLSTDDFVAVDAGGATGIVDPLTTPTTVTPRAAVPPTGSRLVAMDDAARREAEELSRAVVAAPSGPMLASATDPIGQAALVDAKVGEINGRPVRLSELFERLQLGPRLAATAAEFRRANRPRSAWLDGIRSLTRQQLEALLTDELLEAEGRATLSEPQRAGLRNIIQEIGEQGRRREGGRVAFQSQLAQAGTTEQQFLREEERRMLIDYQIQQRIRNRVRVSWKDVQVYYERNEARFNPPPMAVVRMVRVSTRDAAAVERVKAALAGGFEAVAKSADNGFRREQGGLLPGDLKLSELRETGPFDPKSRFGPANEPARGLQVGQVIGPIETAERNESQRDLLWLSLESVSEIKRPLSDPGVQLEILDTLTSDRRVRERDFYISQLMQRASFTSVDDMVDAIVDAAASRYWPL